MSNENQQRTLETEKNFHAKIESFRFENKTKEDQWAQEIEALRITKDAKVRQLEREKEDQRDQYEKRINDLENKIRSKR